MHLIRGLFRRGRDERGNTMAAVMGVMLVGGLLAAAAIASPTKDVGLSRFDQDYKDAFAAAEAGVADYMYHLNNDNAYWAKCTNVAQPNAVNQAWNGTGADPRRWRTVPGATNQYAIELLPANGYSQCTTGSAQQSMIDSDSGSFRIRVTGQARGAKRSIVVTLKRRNFLDYLYFTDYETSDPVWYSVDTGGYPTTPDIVTWASQNCATRYWREGRGSQRYAGKRTINGTDYTWNDTCTEIQFAAGDVIAGPMHTNDEILTCGSPTFGRNAQDRVEVSGPAPGWRPSCGSGSPNFVGTFAPSSPLLTMPPSNTSLKKVVLPGYTFTGRTEIKLNGTSMQVTNATAGYSNTSIALPSNGVVYVQNGSCGQGYLPLNPYGNVTGCADVYVRGTYGKDLTIASEKDVIINEDIIRSGDTMLGLIANNFVRVYHPVQRDVGTPTSCSNGTASMQDVRIDAAILALQHSFTVDNYYCGANLGNLTVNGAIAQKFRGPVGRGSGGSIVSGYTKRYGYDDRLRFRSPPYFLDPVQTVWRISRHSEQTPAR